MPASGSITPTPTRPPARGRGARIRLAGRALAGAAAAPLGLLVATGLPASPAAADTAWSWPVAGRVAGQVEILRPFQAPAGPYGPGHRGVDLAAERGAPVRAAAAGTVVVAGSVAGVPVVVVAHGSARTDDELRTTYQPVEPAVTVGRRVERGKLLGRVGDWPEHSTADCLHWGLRRGSVYLDPTALLHGPARLLPVGPPTASGPGPPGEEPGRARVLGPVPPAVAGGAARPRSAATTPVVPKSAEPGAGSGGAAGAVAAVGAAGAGGLVVLALARHSRTAARRVRAPDGPGG